MGHNEGARASVIPLVRATITQADRRHLRSFVTRRLGAAGDREIEVLEQEVTASLGVAGAVAVSSGTAALHLALMALGIGREAEVIMPSYTCVALLHAVHLCGARPVLIDNECCVRDCRFAPSAEQVRQRLTRSTKAVILPHMFGGLAKIPTDLGVPVIEDFTLSLGARMNGRMAGSWGAIAIASLSESKMISAGQGGIVVSRDKHLVERVRELGASDRRIVSWRQMAPNQLRGAYAPAVNYQMSGLQAALGLSQWTQLPEFIERRIVLARRYTQAFQQWGMLCPDVPTDGSNVFYRYMIPVPGDVPELIARLAAKGIELGRGVFPPLHVLLGLPDKNFPGAMQCVNSLISVPLYPALREVQVKRLFQALECEMGNASRISKHFNPRPKVP